MINRAELLGRLTHEPELHHTPQGTAVCRLRLATNRFVGGAERTDYHDIVAWAKLAEQAAKALTTGEVIYVEGRLHTDSWEKDGHKQQRTRVVASRIHFLGRGHKGTSLMAADVEEMADELDEGADAQISGA